MTSNFVAAAIFGVFGVVSILMSTYWLVMARASRRWPTADGSIETSALCVIPSSEGSAVVSKILFRYSVGGVEYSGNRVFWGDWVAVNPGFAAEEAVARYQRGSRVLVRYSPGNPNLAVLEPERSAVPLIVLLLGCIFVALAGAVVFASS